MKNNIKYWRLPNIIDLALPFFLIGNFFRFYSTNLFIFTLLTSALIIYGFVLLLKCLPNINNGKYIYSVCIILLIFSLSVVVVDNNSIIKSIPQFFANLGFSLALLKAKAGTKRYAFIFLIFFAFISIQIFYGKNPGDIFNVSRNFISVLVILSVSSYYISCEKQSKLPSIIIPLAGMILVMWGIGRAGIASGLILLIGAVWAGKSRPILTVLFLGGILITPIYYSQNFDQLEAIYAGINRLEQLEGDDQRTYINNEYINGLSKELLDLVFGVPLDRLNSIMEVDGNPHNSFIRLHTLFGLFGSIIILTIILISGIRLLILRCHLLFIVLLATLFRSAFDSTAFHGPLDVLIFYCVLRSFDIKISKKIKYGD